jgi:hypothetical protein
MRLNWVLLPREPGSASFYGYFLVPAVACDDDLGYFLAGFAGAAAVA